jgi:transposase-like protein
LADRDVQQTDKDDPVHGFLGFRGLPFPREVITVAVRWYLRYGLSYRDVESYSPNAALRSIT